MISKLQCFLPLGRIQNGISPNLWHLEHALRFVLLSSSTTDMLLAILPLNSPAVA